MPRSAKPPGPAHLSTLPRATASDLKKRGWRGMMKTVRSTGKLLVTNHDEPEAVIIPIAEYSELMRRVEQSEARMESALQELRQGFDRRLSILQDRSTAARLRSSMSGPAKLGGRVKVGVKY